MKVMKVMNVQNFKVLFCCIIRPLRQFQNLNLFLNTTTLEVVQWYTGTVLPPQMLCPERESNKPNDYVLQWYSTTPSPKYYVPSVNRRSQKIVSRAWIEHAASRSSVLRSTDWAIGTFRIEFKPSHVVHSQFDDDLYLEGTNSICTNPSEIHSTALDQ